MLDALHGKGQNIILVTNVSITYHLTWPNLCFMKFTKQVTGPGLIHSPVKKIFNHKLYLWDHIDYAHAMEEKLTMAKQFNIPALKLLSYSSKMA